MDLSIKLGSLCLNNPVIAASGTFGYGLEYSSQVKCCNRPRFASARRRFHQIHSGERHREDIQRWRRHQRITTRFACSGPRIREASCSNSPSKISMPLSRKASWL